MFSTKAIVFLTPLDFATRQDIILVSELPVTAINASVSLMFSSSNSSKSVPSPLITRTLSNSSARLSAFSLSFSMSLMLNPS